MSRTNKNNNSKNTSNKSKITNTNNILIIIIVLLVFSLFVYAVLNKYKKKIYQISQFENTPVTPVTPAIPSQSPTSPNEPVTTISTINDINAKLYGPDGPPPTEIYKSCSATSDIVDFCIDYDNCCSTKSVNNKCFCEHPFTKSCKANYDICMNDPNNISSNTKLQLTEKCKLENSDCCKAYNNIPISSSSFGDQLYRIQMDNIMCNIPLIKNIEQKCLEMCQTNPDCSSYSISRLNCILHNKVSTNQPKLDTNGNEVINTSVKYYIKNVPNVTQN